MSAMLCLNIYQSRSPDPDVRVCSTQRLPLIAVKTKVSAPPLTFMDNKPRVFYHSGSALNVLTSRKRKAGPSKVLLVTHTHLSFFLPNEMATKADANDREAATKASRLFFVIHSNKTVFGGRQIKNTNTQKKGRVG